MAKDGVRKFQLAWDDLLVDRIDAASALGGLKRTEWLRRAAEYVLDNRVKLVERPRDPQVVGCPHPKAQRQQLPYGTICGVCKILVR